MTLVKRLWPSSLAGQMVIVVLITLLSAQAISLWILSSAHRNVIYDASELQLIQRTITLTRLLDETPEIYHSRMVKAASTAPATFWLDSNSHIPEDTESRLDQRFIAKLSRELGEPYRGRVRAWLSRYGKPHCMHPSHRRHDDERFKSTARNCRNPAHRRFGPHDDQPATPFVNFSIQLNDGQWLNLSARTPSIPPLVAKQTGLFLLLSGLMLMLVIILMVRRITRPLGELTQSANRLGLGETVAAIEERGPKDIRQTIHAFNRMHERLQRFVADRTHMLAALSHDLRTPITTLRLRIELLEDSPEKERLLATLEEMQAMTEATLSFAREAAKQEDTRRVDINALTASICDDLEELGMPVTFHEGPDAVLSCRPVSLTRAIRNLIENAVKYGKSAEVSLSHDNQGIRLTINDKGPGIPESMMEKVFEPFYRLESSRNRDTGGIGLGLAITRTIIHNHGGTVALKNLNPGLQVTVTLPGE